MKKIITVLTLLLIATAAQAADVRLGWDAPTTGGALTGYRLYYSSTQGLYTEANSMDIGNADVATVPDLIPGSTYYFVVKAYNSKGNGQSSNEVTQTIPIPVVEPGSPENLHIVVTIDIQVPQAKATKKHAK